MRWQHTIAGHERTGDRKTRVRLYTIMIPIRVRITLRIKLPGNRLFASTLAVARTVTSVGRMALFY